LNPDLIILFVGEIFIILVMYRFILRQWVVAEWEKKFEEEGWLVIRLEPVIDEIEDRFHEKLQDFQSSFFGSVGQMTRKAKELDPMNNIRKAVKASDWGSVMLEYMANKANLGHILPLQEDSEAIKEGVINAKPPLPKGILDK